MILFKLHLNLNTVDANLQAVKILIQVIGAMRLKQMYDVGVSVIEVPLGSLPGISLPREFHMPDHLEIQCADQELVDTIIDRLERMQFGVRTFSTLMSRYMSRDDMGLATSEPEEIAG